ncbi:DUF3024 domain-containing protein [bacterium]|nr:DUF3024 domain-containing protein [bacterium]
MMLTEFEKKRCEHILEQFLERKRPPVHVRDKVDLAYRIKGQSIEIFEIRPRWNKPEDLLEIPVAKAKYVRSIKKWKIYWQRADLKWHLYTIHPEVSRLEEFVAIVEKDESACFFG